MSLCTIELGKKKCNEICAACSNNQSNFTDYKKNNKKNKVRNNLKKLQDMMDNDVGM